MKTRELTFTKRPNGDVHREYNHLRISNMDYFLEATANTFEPYRSPFQILEDLENQIKFSNNPKESLLIGYKDDGDCIFDLVEIALGGDGRRIVTYEYSTTIS